MKSHGTCPTCGQATESSEIIITVGNTTINRRNQTIEVAGVIERLTNNEFGVFDALLRERGQVVEREDIERQIDPSHAGYRGGSRSTADIHISKTRQKLAKCGSDIVINGIRGRGYVIE